MHIEFYHGEAPVPWGWLAPFFAAGAFLAPLAVARSWRWRLTVILLPLLAAALLALALAGPQLIQARHQRIILLLDLSASTRTSPWRDPAWVRRLVERRLGNHRPVTVVAFADEPRLLLDSITAADPWPDRWPSDISSVARSDLRAALAWRAPDEGPLHPRWILTDGLVPAPPPVDAPLAYTLLPPTAADAGITDLQLRPISADELELLARIRICGSAPSTNSASQVTLRLFRDDRLITQQAIAIPPGNPLDIARWIAIRDTHVDTGRMHRYAVALESSPADPWPENDRATIAWLPPEARRILTLTSSATAPSTMPTGDIHRLPIQQFHDSAARLAADGIQAILLDDLPLQSPPETGPSITPEQARILDQFVRDTGGGLLIAGREHAFGPGHYADAQPPDAAALLESLSPVWSRPHSGARLHLLFLLDASGSMNQPAPHPSPPGAEPRFRLLARAVEEAAGRLSADDRLTVLTFNQSALTLADASAGEVVPQLAARLAAITPTGATVPDSALPQLQAALAAPDTGLQERLLVLVTDGELSTLDLPAWKSLLTSPASASAPHLLIIAPPASPDSPLRRLAASLPAATWLSTPSPADWQRQISQAVALRTNGRIHRMPLPWRAAVDGFSPPGGVFSQWIDIWPKPESTLLLRGAAPAEPPPAPPSPSLAAIAQRGLGKVAAIASPADANLLDQLLDRIAAPAGDRRFSIAVQKSPQGWRLTAEATEDHRFLNHQSLQVRVLTQNSTRDIPLPQTAPGHYEALLPRGLAAIVTRDTPASSPSEELVARVPLPDVESSEWPASVDKPFVPPAGAVAIAPDDASIWQPAPTGAISLTTPLLLLAIVLVLLALWLR